MPLTHVVQEGGVPEVPTLHPTHAAPERVSGAAHSRGTQSAFEEGAVADAGCDPTAHTKAAPARHEDAEDAPATAVDDPTAQGTHFALLAATVADDHVPCAHSVHAAMPEEAPKEPGPHALHAGAPARAEEPATHATHVAEEFAPVAALAVPAGHATHAADDCPGALL